MWEFKNILFSVYVCAFIYIYIYDDFASNTTDQWYTEKQIV